MSYSDKTVKPATLAAEMWKPCLICSVYHLEMISIYRHPKKLDYILKFVLGLQAKQDDYLCKVCCDQILEAFDSKKKFNQSKLHEPKVLSDGISVEHNLVDQIEISSSESEEDTEPKSDEGKLVSEILISSNESEEGIESKSEESLVEVHCEIFVVDDENLSKICEKWLSDYNLKLKNQLEGQSRQSSSIDGLELQRDIRGTANENLSASQSEATCSKVSEEQQEPRRGVEEDFNAVSLHVDSTQSDSEHTIEDFRKYYKREKSVDIDDNKDEEETLSGRSTKEADVVRKHQQDEDIQCGICDETCCSTASYEVHMTEEHLSRKKLLDSPVTEQHCHLFNQTFSSKDDLKKYDSNEKRDTRKYEREIKKPYKCPYCSKKFPTNYHKKRHVSTHLRKKRHKCSDCGIYFATESSLESHKIIHTAERSLKCNHCSMAFRYKFELSSHLQMHVHEEKDKSCECSECGKSFSTGFGLGTHVLTHMTFQNTKEHKHVKRAAEKRRYMCCYCSQTTRDRYDLKRHISTHLKKKRHKCSVCQIYFATESSLESHKIMHTTERSLKCSHCSMAFRYKFELSSHLQTHIQEEKENPCEHVCPECGKGLSSSAKLRCHIRSHAKPYICCECGKGYGYLANLKIHQMEHTGERPFVCPHCSIGFKTNYNLSRHIKVHTEERTYECPHCPKAYKTNYNLLRHVRVHTKKVIRRCSVCSKSFDDPRWLLAHQLHSHTEKRPYECPYCPKLFKSRSGFGDHLVKHMGELGDDLFSETDVKSQIASHS